MAVALHQAMVVETVVLAVAEEVLLKLVLEVQAVVLPVILALLERLVLLGQMVVQAEQIQAAVLVREIPFTQAQLVTVVLALSLFATPARKKALAVLLHRLADTPSTHLHRLARIQHKENVNGTFCKSTRRHRYASYCC